MVDIYLLTTEIVLAVTAVTELLLDILDRRHKRKAIAITSLAKIRRSL